MIRPGGNLDIYVRDWVADMKLRPADAAKPENLEALLRAADVSWDGSFVANHSPVAPLTWEEQALLHFDDVESERTKFNFPYRMEVVGMRPSLSVIQPITTGMIVPTLDDIQVAIDINEAEHLTSLDGQATTASTKRGGNFVSLAAIGVQVPRLFGLKLVSPQPELGMTFRWKQLPASGAVPPDFIGFADVLIGVSLYVREIDHRDSANVPSQYER